MLQKSLTTTEGTGIHPAVVHEDHAVSEGRVGNHARDTFWANHDVQGNRGENREEEGASQHVRTGGRQRGGP